MNPYPHLFSPLNLGGLRLANRITMAPMYMGYADFSGRVTTRVKDHYRRMGASGAGMVMVENAIVDTEGLGSPFNLRLDEDRFVPGMTELAAAVKAGGAMAGLQLNHAGRYAFGKEIIAPSAVPFGPYLPRAMDRTDIDRVAAGFASAARRAREAGFDLVELHGATGYLLAQFVSPRTNLREDEYGGDRLRFPQQVIRAVRNAVGPDYPVGYRFMADEWLADGLTVDQSVPLAGRLAAEGLAYLSVTGGTYESFNLPRIVEEDRRPGYMTDLASAVKGGVSIPVITAGRIQQPALAENILARGRADLIGLARVLTADPLWPKKAVRGQVDDIVACEPTCRLCWKRVGQGKTVICSQWPEELRRKAKERD